MARRRSFTAALAQAQREAVRAQERAVRESERYQKTQLRLQAANERDRKRLYAEIRGAEITEMNAELEATVEALQSLLQHTLTIDDYLDFAQLKQTPVLPVWQHGQLEQPYPAPDPAQFRPPPLAGLGKLFGKAKHEQAFEAGRAAYEEAVNAHQSAEEARLAELARQRDLYQAAVAAAKEATAAQHAQVDDFETNFAAGDPEAVVAYFELVLQASDYPDAFSRTFRLAYVPESRQAVVEYDLPPVSIVPPVKTYRYVKTSDKIAETLRPEAQVKALYASVVAQVTLRTVHELFEADRGRHLDVVVFNGVLHTVDPGSGQNIKPCLVTVRTTREQFAQLDLSLVEPLACLKHLSAGVSKNPKELIPVRPVLEFDMVDPRFVAESDALTLLDERPNLMELNPWEFESLIQNLFTKMGLESRQTQPSRDGGVDCVAYDPRPIFGGKVVIQAKRWKNTIGVSAVRDLFGTLQNEGASKGILVTTSGYGPASFEFAQNKPIELIDGANLLYLLREHTGLEATIVPPDDWTDPVGDIADITT
jgi:restriction system protein